MHVRLIFFLRLFYEKFLLVFERLYRKGAPLLAGQKVYFLIELVFVQKCNGIEASEHFREMQGQQQH